METNRETEKQIDAAPASSTQIISDSMQIEDRKIALDYDWLDRYLDLKSESYEEGDSESYENWSNSQSSNMTDDLSPPPIIEDLVEEVKRPGRKKEPDSQLLSRFLTINRKKGIPPKKEYLRCKLIRGHKKLNRQIKSGILSSKHICAFSPENTRGLEIWNRLQKHFFANKNVLEVESKTESGPSTDGKKKRSRVDKATQKSFNAAFIRQYFKHEATKLSFYYYIELIFLELDPETLCKKFQFVCCLTKNHFEKCRESWLELKNYLQRKMFTDLGIIPYTPTDESPSTHENEECDGLFSTTTDFQAIVIEDHMII